MEILFNNKIFLNKIIFVQVFLWLIMYINIYVK